MATVREGVMRPLYARPGSHRRGRAGRRPHFQPGDLALQVLSRQVRPPSVHLKDAPVIVAGGGGVGSRKSSS